MFDNFYATFGVLFFQSLLYISCLSYEDQFIPNVIHRLFKSFDFNFVFLIGKNLSYIWENLSQKVV